MSENKQGFALGMLIGGLVGAAAALLYAPQKGEEAREKMKSKAMDAKHRATEAAGGVKESAEHLKTRGTSYIETKRAQLHEAVEAGKRAAAEKEAELKSGTTEPRSSI